MDVRFGFRRGILVAVATLVLLGGTLVDSGEANAASKKKNKKNDERNTAEVVFTGYTSRHSSCEGKLQVWVHYTVKSDTKGNKAAAVSAEVDSDGRWSVTAEKVAKGELTATAALIHPEDGFIFYDKEVASTKSNRRVHVDYDRLTIDNC